MGGLVDHGSIKRRRLAIGVALIVLPGLLLQFLPAPQGGTSVLTQLGVATFRLGGVLMLILAGLSWMREREDRAG